MNCRICLCAPRAHVKATSFEKNLKQAIQTSLTSTVPSWSQSPTALHGGWTSAICCAPPFSTLVRWAVPPSPFFPSSLPAFSSFFSNSVVFASLLSVSVFHPPFLILRCIPIHHGPTMRPCTAICFCLGGSSPDKGPRPVPQNPSYHPSIPRKKRFTHPKQHSLLFLQTVICHSISLPPFGRGEGNISSRHVPRLSTVL